MENDCQIKRKCQQDLEAAVTLKNVYNKVTVLPPPKKLYILNNLFSCFPCVFISDMHQGKKSLHAASKTACSTLTAYRTKISI